MSVKKNLFLNDFIDKNIFLRGKVFFLPFLRFSLCSETDLRHIKAIELKYQQNLCRLSESCVFLGLDV